MNIDSFLKYFVLFSEDMYGQRFYSSNVHVPCGDVSLLVHEDVSPPRMRRESWQTCAHNYKQSAFRAGMLEF